MTSRRSFLAGLLAAAAAPAIVRSESLMKLWVPPQDIIVPHPALGDGNWTLNADCGPCDWNNWRHVAIVRSDGIQRAYLNGVRVRHDHPAIAALAPAMVSAINQDWERANDVARVPIEWIRGTRGIARL